MDIFISVWLTSRCRMVGSKHMLKCGKTTKLFSKVVVHFETPITFMKILVISYLYQYLVLPDFLFS